jgi:hypothetical protein
VLLSRQQIPQHSNNHRNDVSFIEKVVTHLYASLDNIYSQMEGKHRECDQHIQRKAEKDCPGVNIYKEKLKKIVLDPRFGFYTIPRGSNEYDKEHPKFRFKRLLPTRADGYLRFNQT